MSEPVTNAEIEDVLSSIRRLVTEENRPDQRQKPKEQPDKSGRLVLTPSLRVAEDAAERDDLATQGLETGGPAGELVEDAAATGPAGEPWRAPGATLFGVMAHAAESVGAGPEFAPEEPDANDSGPPSAEADLNDDASGHEAMTAVMGARRQGTDPDAEHTEALSTSQPVDEMPDAPAGPQDVDLDQDTPEQAEADPAGSAVFGAGPEDESAIPGQPEQHLRLSGRAESLSAKIEALEAAIGQTRDQWEPDGEVGDDYAGTRIETIAWRDHEDDGAGGADGADGGDDDAPAVTHAAAGRPEGEDQDQALDTLSAEEAILDEDALREMVADIVREELQGALGERITRNVRKLVRREIHRALTAQELE